MNNPPPRFHDDLHRLLAARGWSAHHASFEAGLGEHVIAYCPQRGSYPRSPDDYSRLAAALGGPSRGRRGLACRSPG